MVPPRLTQDPNYDIPVPSAAEAQQKATSGYRTLPNPHKPEWIYDVPGGPEKQSPPHGSYDTMPSKAVCRQLFGTPSDCGLQKYPPHLVYDIPKPTADCGTSPKDLPIVPIYDKPPTQKPTEESVCVAPPQEKQLGQVLSDQIPLVCRVNSNNAQQLKKVRLQRMRNFISYTSFQDLPETRESLVKEDEERSRSACLTSADSQRISTASSSSSSSCDSLALSSSSPEPLREVTLSQEEACRRLLDLQQSVCRAVPQLMNFVSSHWRMKEHLEKHLKEIREAADGIGSSLMCFLNFALDIKGNAHRLTDVNLQTRLYKQLSIVEDSGVILQQTLGALNIAGWPLNTLCQDPKQVQTPDQLDRFVMVARTVPDDVKRLVSIFNANGKLLFRPSSKDPELLNSSDQPETKKTLNRNQQGVDSVEDDNDYVELQVRESLSLLDTVCRLLILKLNVCFDFSQTESETQKQHKEMQRNPKLKSAPLSNKAQVSIPKDTSHL